MRGTIAYARALSLPGGGLARAAVEVVAVLGAGMMFASAPWSPAFQTFGGAIIASMPVAVAQRAGPSPGVAVRPLALPTLPVTPTERAVAVVLLSALRMLPAAGVVLLAGRPAPAVLEHLTAAVGLLAGWTAVSRLVEIEWVQRDGQAALMGGFLLGMLVLPAAALPWCLAAGVALTALAWAVDRTPGISGARVTSLPYREHRLDRVASPRLLTADAPREVVRLGLRDGLMLGLVALPIALGHRVVLGRDPAGNLEELLASVAWAARSPQGWVFVLVVLSMAAPLIASRSVVLPGHSVDPTLRANALAPLRWLPVRRGEVWRHTGRVATLGWLAFVTGAGVPLGLAAVWLADGLGAMIAVTSLATAALGTAAVVQAQRVMPLKVLDEGPRAPSPVAYFVATAMVMAPSFVLLMQVWLTVPLVWGEDIAMRFTWAYLFAVLALLVLVVASFRKAAAARG